MSVDFSPVNAIDQLDKVRQYHQATKHDFNRYARALGYMDWANQPNPFRRYEGARLTRLPLLTLDEFPFSPGYEDLYRHQSISPQPIVLETLSRFFEYALSITAWKQAGETRWALRSNPSSGNLHPTEGYLFLGEIPELPLSPGLYHYTPKEHALEQRLACRPEQAYQLLKGFPPQAFLVGLSSIHWREAWKYGERAFRYCQHDIGHAIGTLRIAAVTLGWNMLVLAGTADDTVARLLGIDRSHDTLNAEREYPELLAVIWSTTMSTTFSVPLCLETNAVDALVHEPWSGQANRLSRDNPIPWEIIEEVTKASWKFETHASSVVVDPPASVVSPCLQDQDHGTGSSSTAGQIIHQRRSALAFDGATSIVAERFFTMLMRVMPRAELPISQRPMPWDCLPWDPTIHLALFVHRVDGILPGMYMLLRNPDHAKKEEFQKAMHEQFLWTIPPGCPKELPLYLLEDGNAQKIAMQVSCWQEIGGDSAFALGMITEFESALQEHGPWFYKRLFWEAGLIGQVLYLEAEAAGVRATGIGCFFDDPVHRVLGFHNAKFQSLYHFTTGGHVEDTRLTTLPAYGDHVT